MDKKIKLLQVLSKTSDGKYRAVLSDTSIDRDDEIVSEKALRDSCMTPGQTPILLNHDNDIEKRIGHWTNKRIEKIDNHTAFVAEPVFYKSNPKGMMIKGMLDEGAELGISIGAIVKETSETKIDNKSYTTYDKLELLEASFVGVQSNRSGLAMAVAKKFGGIKMTEDMVKKVDLDKKVEELTKVTSELEALKKEKVEFTKKVADFEKSGSEKDTKIASLEKDVKDQKTTLEKEKKELTDKNVITEKALEKNKEAFTKLAKSPIFKATFGEAENIDAVKSEGLSDDAQIDKAYKDGMLPVIGDLGGK